MDDLQRRALHQQANRIAKRDEAKAKHEGERYGPLLVEWVDYDGCAHHLLYAFGKCECGNDMRRKVTQLKTLVGKGCQCKRLTANRKRRGQRTGLDTPLIEDFGVDSAPRVAKWVSADWGYDPALTEEYEAEGLI